MDNIPKIPDALLEQLLASGDDGATAWPDTDDDAPAWKLRLRVEPDYDASVSDFPDCYGTMEWADRYCRSRPVGFDGAARKMGNRDGSYWWQPPADIKSDPKVIEVAARSFARLMEEGFWSVGLELLTRCDKGHEHVAASAWLGGIDELDHAYLADILPDLARELG